jgi:hypothetical protein
MQFRVWRALRAHLALRILILVDRGWRIFAGSAIEVCFDALQNRNESAEVNVESRISALENDIPRAR